MTELAKAMGELGFNPLSVKNISVRNKQYDDHAVYIVHFLKSEKMQIATLRENAGVINCVRVKWEFFQNKRKVQCNVLDACNTVMAVQIVIFLLFAFAVLKTTSQVSVHF